MGNRMMSRVYFPPELRVASPIRLVWVGTQIQKKLSIHPWWKNPFMYWCFRVSKQIANVPPSSLRRALNVWIFNLPTLGQKWPHSSGKEGKHGAFGLLWFAEKNTCNGPNVSISKRGVVLLPNKCTNELNESAWGVPRRAAGLRNKNLNLLAFEISLKKHAFHKCL